MNETTAPTIGQVSTDGQFRWDGQQWAPIPKGQREATSWTRPMRLAAAVVFAVEAVFSVTFAILYDNHAAMVQLLKAQGTQIPPGMTIDQLADTALAFAIGGVVFVAILSVIAAIGSYLGWRWMFWAALVLFAFGSIGAVGNISNLVRPGSSPYPVGVTLFNEVVALASVAMFVWMLIGAIKFGPWAMKKPGA